MVSKEPQLRPSDEDAARRLVILKYVVVYTITAPPRDMLEKLIAVCNAEEEKKFIKDTEKEMDHFWRPFHETGLWDHVSPNEREFAANTITSMSFDQQVNASWRMEAVQVLMWALGLIRQLPAYDTMAGHDLLKMVPSDFPKFIASARLRNEAVIDDARDLAELWHWRSRTRQLIEEARAFPADAKMKAAGFHSFDDIVRFTARKSSERGRIPACIDDDFPAKGKAYRKLTSQEWSEVRSIRFERHFALNWLCGFAPGNEWDETPTGT